VVDATEVAQKLLSAVYRTGQSFGFGYLEKVLTGQQRRAHRGSAGMTALSFFGIVDGEEAQAAQAAVARAAGAADTLVPTEHGGLLLSGAARAIS
jgi:ATP-dependent DNA helicase RecQ